MGEIPISSLGIAYCYVDPTFKEVVLELYEGRSIITLTKDDLKDMLKALEETN